MKLRVLRRKTKEISEFSKREWQNADLEHYGKVKNFTPEFYFIIARDTSNQLIGSAHVMIMAGVMEIHNVIISQSVRGTGVGQAVMKKVEEFAKKKSVHKLFLNTGKGWRAELFYQKLGFTKTGDLPNHFAGRDFVEYSKII